MPPTHEEPVGQTRPIEPAQPRVVLDLPAASAEAELLAHIMAPVRVDPDTWFILDSVTFATGSSEIPSEANAQISRVAQVLERNPDVKLELAGHADGPGSTQVNQRLSLARAQRARHALIEKGIDGTRIEARGDGEIRSLEQTRSESQRYSGVAVRVIAR